MDSIEIKTRLMALRDDRYRQFQCKLMPTVDPATVLGIRIPELRRLCRELKGRAEVEAFLSCLPHSHYDENNLHVLLLSAFGDYDELMIHLERFLPCIDNWATCDLLRPAVFHQHKAELLPQIRKWLLSDHEYTVRFALEMLMVHYLDEPDITGYLAIAAGIDREEYYIRMMVAWFFATALTKQYDQTLPCLERRSLPVWVHNKAIQKATESDQIPPEKKAYLRTLKI